VTAAVELQAWGALVVARLRRDAKAEADETVGCLWGQGDGKREEFGDGFVCSVWWGLFIGASISPTLHLLLPQ
jgi:hypothetical protein